MWPNFCSAHCLFSCTRMQILHPQIDWDCNVHITIKLFGILPLPIGRSFQGELQFIAERKKERRSSTSNRADQPSVSRKAVSPTAASLMSDFSTAVLPWSVYHKGIEFEPATKDVFCRCPLPDSHVKFVHAKSDKCLVYIPMHCPLHDESRVQSSYPHHAPNQLGLHQN